LLTFDGFVFEIGNVASAVNVGTVRVGEPVGSLLHVLEKGLRMNSHFVDLSQEEEHEVF
jgi:hypothetical protein